ncbi:MAG TPA: ADOP family duplicated permease [Terracidiphilus sp.]|nr:ADOP family duplicated permease [Terracidiphilus sp.]
MRSIVQDARYAVRQFRKSPGFTAAAVLTLALGIGSSSAIFCLMDGLWMHPMRIPHPGKIVRIFGTTPQDQDAAFSYTEYQAMAQRATAFQGQSAGLAAIGGRGSLMPRPDGTSQLLLTNVVSSNFFSVLGVQPLEGRVFTTHDTALLRTHPAVMLGFNCWKKYFNGDPNIVGKQIPLRHGQFGINKVDVWGVLPPSFRELDPSSDRDLWMPAETWAALVGEGELTSREFRWFNLIGRLAPGANVAQANEQAAAIAGALKVADPANNHDRGARAISDFKYRMTQAGAAGKVLLAIVGGVLLLAIVNVAHLLLARALTRAPEVALRLSLGARRWVVARQLLVESLLLSMVSLFVGLALAAGLAIALPRLLIEQPAMLESYGSGIHFTLDARIYAFAAMLALVTILLLAFVPLSQVVRSELLPVMQANAVTRTAGRVPLMRRAAVWLQIGISFALLISTGAMVRSFLNTRTHDIGLTRDQALLLWTQEPDAPMRDAVLANLRALPGVEDVSYAIRSPLMPSEGGIAVKALLPSHPELRNPVDIKFNAVSPEFLAVTGTRVLRGRGFASADNQTGAPVVIINQLMAEKYWPGQNPIGQTVRMLGTSGGANGVFDAHVVGVSENAPINSIGEIPEPYLYVPWEQYQAHLGNMGEIAFILRTRQNAMSMAQDARQVLIHANPLLDPMLVTSLPELIRYSAGNYQMMAELVSALGLIGLALTAVGLYGFLAFRVTQRWREIGLRMALGATREGIAWLVVCDTAGIAAIGLGLGVLLSFAAARVETAVLFGVQPLDAISFAAALTVLSPAVLIASLLPARRAAKIEPMQALRSE